MDDRMNLTFLHTSPIHIERFEKIVRNIDSSIKMNHYVNEDILKFALEHGEIDAKGFKKEIANIRKQDAAIIICTCSTYGELCEESQGVFRIDKPMASYIVSNFQNIGIAFTSTSTKAISKKLIAQLAQQQDKNITITEIDCSTCWQWFEAGNVEKYETEISKTIQKEINGQELVFLCQASMEGAKRYLKNESYPVFSSGTYGVEQIINTLFS